MSQSEIDYLAKLAKYNAKFNGIYGPLQYKAWPFAIRDAIISHGVLNSQYMLPVRPKVILTQSAIDKINNNNNKSYDYPKNEIIQLIRQSSISMGFASDHGVHNYTVFDFKNEDDAHNFSKYLAMCGIYDEHDKQLDVQPSSDNRYHYVALDVIATLSLISVIVGSPVATDNVKSISGEHGEFFRVKLSESDGTFIHREVPSNNHVLHFVRRHDEAIGRHVHHPLRYSTVIPLHIPRTK
jgi:hypothetical protein